MSARLPIQLKFSNLLQSNPQSCFYGFDANLEDNTQNSNILFEKIRRKSLNIGCMKPKKVMQSYSPQMQKIKIKEYIQKSKINRLLLEANFDQEIQDNKSKKKKIYIIRKRQQKSRKDSKDQKSLKALFQKKQKSPSNQQINQKPKPTSLPKRRKKVPIFGLQDVAPNSLIQKRKLSSRGTGLFNSTSSNCFYNTTFFINSKIKQFQQAREVSKMQGHHFSPAIRSILPHPLNNEPLLERKKQIQKFYTTNTSNFTFTRSKTEQIDTNYLCGWEKQELEFYENQDII